MYAAFEFMFPEFRLPLPETEVTVCGTVSVLFHVTVLFTPITTLIMSGEYPGAPCGPAPEPLGISMRVPLVFDEPLLLEVAALDVDTDDAAALDVDTDDEDDDEELPLEDVELLLAATGGCVAE